MVYLIFTITIQHKRLELKEKFLDIERSLHMEDKISHWMWKSSKDVISIQFYFLGVYSENTEDIYQKKTMIEYNNPNTK